LIIQHYTICPIVVFPLAGEQYTVTWSDNVSGDVKIELFKSGTLHSTIIESTPSDGSKTWGIPFNMESDSTYRIKIASIDNPNIFDFSDANFNIEGFEVVVISPNGGENWFSGNTHIITWNSNLTSNVELHLFKGGEFHSVITASTANDGLYTWNISPSIMTGSDYRIKILSTNDAMIFDFSDADFTIISNNITVTSPNGGENWLIGGVNSITWTDDISGELKIDLYKGGLLDTTIAQSVPSSGSFEWDFANAAPGIDYQIKISSVDQPALFDLSDNNFSLFSGLITVDSPNGGETWLAGSSQTVFWDDNIDGDVIIDLYRADTLHSIISGPTASDGAKNWDLPFDIQSGNDYQVKITSVENPTIFDLSDNNFSIEGFEITVTSPNGGEVWYVGQDYNITWTDNLTGSVEIQLFKNGDFHSVIDASDPSDGIKTWSIPAGQETGTDYTIRIASADNSNIFDFSDTTFTLAHTVFVESPNGGESWQAGSTQTITWSDNLVGNVRIELHKNGSKYSDIISSAPSNGSYAWDIPVDIEADVNYKVKIISSEDTSIYDYSDNDFEIFAGSITVVSPNGGELWRADEVHTIHWTSDITENVKIELFKSGLFHSTITASTTNDGAYNWQIPFTQETGSDYQLKISGTSNPNTFDFSDGNFTIIGNYVIVLKPNGGEDWVRGESYFITWESNLVGNVEIFLVKADGLHLVIEESETNDGGYVWTIPSDISTDSDYKIHIGSRDNGLIYDRSDTVFTITNATDVDELFSGIPKSYELKQNFPNPFNPSTTIYYALPEESAVELLIYDVLGNQVLSYSVDKQSAGYHKYIFNAAEYNSGVYIYRLRTNNYIETKKMVLMK
jgi:hypothetical protein